MLHLMRRSLLIQLLSVYSLAELSDPISNVIQAQQRQGRRLMISVIDGQGELVATSDPRRLLQTVLDQLPGADRALQGRVVSQVGIGSDGQDWLFSAVPVPDAGWAVVVQRPVSEALAVATQFQFWLLAAALLFAIGGLLFWLMLLMRVIRPLHTLALQHQALPTSEQFIRDDTTGLGVRDDEVGNLTRSLIRLERDGLKKLGELRTLLETSNAVVRSLEPHAVVGKIIHEVRRLVDVQAAAVLLPDEKGVLHVLESSGHSEHYDHSLSLSPEQVNSAPVLALSSGKPVQKLVGPQTSSLSYEEGYRTVLAIPIISRHAGVVVLLVHITAERQDDAMIVAVANNGPGIEPDELPHVFERFYRARYGRQQRSGGTGLGLAICKAFIEAHSGIIWAESSLHGTTISFSLPLVSS